MFLSIFYSFALHMYVFKPWNVILCVIDTGNISIGGMLIFLRYDANLIFSKWSFLRVIYFIALCVSTYL